MSYGIIYKVDVYIHWYNDYLILHIYNICTYRSTYFVSCLLFINYMYTNN